jgi:hypothetical protein
MTSNLDDRSTQFNDMLIGLSIGALASNQRKIIPILSKLSKIPIEKGLPLPIWTSPILQILRIIPVEESYQTRVKLGMFG